MSFFGIGKGGVGLLFRVANRNPKTAIGLGALGMTMTGGWGKMFPHGLAYEATKMAVGEENAKRLANIGNSAVKGAEKITTDKADGNTQSQSVQQQQTMPDGQSAQQAFYPNAPTDMNSGSNMGLISSLVNGAANFLGGGYNLTKNLVSGGGMGSAAGLMAAAWLFMGRFGLFGKLGSALLAFLALGGLNRDHEMAQTASSGISQSQSQSQEQTNQQADYQSRGMHR